MLCRNEKRGREAYEFLKQERPERNIDLMLCDLGNLRSFRSFVLAFKSGHQTIDMLINNAGFISLDRQLTDDGFECQLGINHLGHFSLTEQLIPFMKSVRWLHHRQHPKTWRLRQSFTNSVKNDGIR